MEKGKSKLGRIVINLFHKFIYWIFPLAVLAYFNSKYELIGLTIPLAVLWYFALLIKKTSDKIYREKININRLTGRFKGIRKFFYRFVLIIPIIGKQKVPF